MDVCALRACGHSRIDPAAVAFVERYLGPMPKLCVFDCDGTLVDSQQSIAEAMAMAFVDSGLEPPPAISVRRVVGLPLVTAISRLVPLGEPALFERIADGYRQAFAALRKRGQVAEPLFPGVCDGLEAFERGGWLLGIATGKSHRGLLATLAVHGLGDRFITLQSADTAAGKPSPDMMLRAMADTGAEPHESVMIGDTVFDVQMALNAEALAIGVSWGYHHEEELHAAGAHAVVDDFTALPDTVARLLEAR